MVNGGPGIDDHRVAQPGSDVDDRTGDEDGAGPDGAPGTDHGARMDHDGGGQAALLKAPVPCEAGRIVADRDHDAVIVARPGAQRRASSLSVLTSRLR